MAGNRGELRQGYGDVMVTRRKRPNYFILNDGSDDEALPEDRIQETVQSEPNSPVNTPSSAASEPEILPSESQTQIGPIPPSSSSAPRLRSHKFKCARPAPPTAWLWDHFTVTEVNREWIANRTGKRE